MTKTSDPKAAKRASQISAAVALHQKRDYKAAIPLYRALLAEKPDDATVWTNLGAALRSLGQLDTAVLHHRRALSHDPRNASAQLNLCNAHRDAGDYDIARRDGVMNSAGFHAGKASSVARDLAGLGHWRASITAFDKAIEEDPKDAELKLLRSTSHFMTGDFTKALDDYSQRFLFAPSLEPKRESPRWTDITKGGKRLLIMGEQGLGDLILVSRFIPQIRHLWEEIWLTSRGPTMRLFEDVPYIDKVFKKDEPPKEGLEDAHLPSMDLMRLCGLTPQNCPPPPPLSINAQARARAEKVIAPYQRYFKIGICWAGSPTFVHAKRKAAELERFLSLADIRGVQLFGLCKGEREADIAELGAEALVVNSAATERDLADTAAVIEKLDLVVTVDTSICHLAASLGKPTWMLLARPPFWYWGPFGERTYWYSSMRLIRQIELGNWEAPFRLIRADIENALL